jgi:hypothetical protein
LDHQIFPPGARAGWRQVNSSDGTNCPWHATAMTSAYGVRSSVVRLLPRRGILTPHQPWCIDTIGRLPQLATERIWPRAAARCLVGPDAQAMNCCQSCVRR